MSKILVLLESPSKVTKIQHYLEEAFPQNKYKVMASVGHINKIANQGVDRLGIDLSTMQPKFVPEKGKKQIIKEILKAGKKSDLIVVASDPDREGEAIAWHLANLFIGQNKTIKRATFNEITAPAVIEAFNHLTEINQDLVKAQLSRQMLDKIIGYLTSKALQKNTGLMSAGRVQTPALFLLSERHQLIKNFKEVNYHRFRVVEAKRQIDLILNKDKNDILVNTDDTYYINDSAAKTIFDELNEKYRVINYKAVPFETRSFKPYSTASLLQDSFTKLHFSSSQTTLAAQKLYELGYVTYIRTDAVKYSQTFIAEAKNYIQTNFGEKIYAPLIIPNKKDKRAQEAHESIRPTDLNLTPTKIESLLGADSNLQKRLYRLIWWNTVKSLMHGPKGINHRWSLNNSGYKFNQSWQEINDWGYKQFDRKDKEADLELDDNGQLLTYNQQTRVELPTTIDSEVIIGKENIIDEKTKTRPPKMFNQASLIRELKNLNIGRPSTYNPILTKLKDRDYVKMARIKPIEVTHKGDLAKNYLYDSFDNFFDLNYTAKMEEILDEISVGSFDYENWLKRIYEELKEKTTAEVDKAQTSDLVCPKCGEGNLVFIKSRFQRGRGCSNFTKTGCSYREYEQANGNWVEYVAPEKPKPTIKKTKLKKGATKTTKKKAAKSKITK